VGYRSWAPFCQACENKRPLPFLSSPPFPRTRYGLGFLFFILKWFGRKEAFFFSHRLVEWTTPLPFPFFLLSSRLTLRSSMGQLFPLSFCFSFIFMLYAGGEARRTPSDLSEPFQRVTGDSSPSPLPFFLLPFFKAGIDSLFCLPPPLFSSLFLKRQGGAVRILSCTTARA